MAGQLDGKVADEVAVIIELRCSTALSDFNDAGDGQQVTSRSNAPTPSWVGWASSSTTRASCPTRRSGT